MATLARLRGPVRRSRLVNVRDRVRRRSLAELGRRAGLPDSSSGLADLDRIEAAIGERRVRRLAVIVEGAGARRLGWVFARRYPGAEVHVLQYGGPAARLRSPRRRVRVHVTPALRDLHHSLAPVPGLDVVIDLARVREVKTAAVRHLPFHLRPGGLYVLGALDTLASEGRGREALDAWQALARILAVKAEPRRVELLGLPPDERSRAEAIASATHDGHLVSVVKQGRHALKVHDADAEAVLAGRIGSRWGRRLDERAPVKVRATVRPHANRLAETFRRDLSVPRLYLREYREVVCAPRQVAIEGDVVLPIAFHHGLRPRLLHRSPLLRDADDHFIVPDESLAAPEPLPGRYYHLDSEFPGHFGHFMTEDVAKLWGWTCARELYPDLKVLVSTMRRGSGPSIVQRVVLEAWGVAAEDVVVIDHPVRVDVLVGATQMFYNGIYVHPELLEVWATLRERLRPPVPARRPMRKIFVTRPARSLRPCRNAERLEELAGEYGFEVVRPETLSIPEQVDLFADAEEIAGFGGSGLFNAIYARAPGRRIVITSDQYLARNEWAIAAAKGDEYHHFFARAEVHREDLAPADRWRAFQSGFTFDLAADGPALRALLRG